MGAAAAPRSRACARACGGDPGALIAACGLPPTAATHGTISTAGWPGYGGGSHDTIAWMSMEECGNAPAGYILP